MDSVSKEVEFSDIKEFVKFFNLGIKKFGIKKIIGKLEELYVMDDESFDYVFDLCVNYTCGHFGISRDLFFSKYAHGDITKAKKIACVLVLGYSGKTPKYLSSYFGLSRQTIHSYYTEHKSLDVKNKYDMEHYFKHFNPIHEKIENHIVKQFNITDND